MPSSLNLSTLRSRVSQLLQDNTNDTWSTDDIDAAIRLALARLNERRPRQVTDSIDTEAREIDVSALNVLDPNSILDVWFPYDAADSNARPTWIDFETFIYNDTLYLRLLNCADPAPGDVARVVFYAPHTLDGLDDASATTFYSSQETTLAKGAAAFAFLQRSGGVSEDPAIMSVATPNQAALFSTWLQEFEKSLSAPAAGIAAFPHYEISH